jgi:hypothetical protein
MQTDGLEKKLCNSILRLLRDNPVLEECEPRLWDVAEKKQLPRVGIKASRGEELIYRTGIYRVSVEITVQTKAKDKERKDSAEGIAKEAEMILLLNTEAHELATDGNVHVFAFESEGMDNSSDTDKRIATLKLSAVCAEK